MGTDGRWRILRAATLAASLATSACTSISWDDADGVRHHLGLVAVETLEQDGARVVRRYAIGSDLDASRGGAWTLGYARTERVHVFESRVDDPRILGREFLEEIDTAPPAAESTGAWSFFYATEDDSSRAAVVARTTFGAGVGWGPELSGVWLGYADGNAVDPRVVGEDAVLHVSRRPGYDPRYRLWRVGAEPSGERGVER
jgi:hypothetical protein